MSVDCVVRDLTADQEDLFDVKSGATLCVVGWVFHSYSLHAVYADADGDPRTIPAHAIKVTHFGDRSRSLEVRPL